MMQAEAQKRGLSLVVEDLSGGRIITADAVAIRRALRYLLLHSLQRSPAGGTVTARAESTPKEIRIRISDTGPGITDEELPHLFDDFYSGETGSGLGLAIVQEVARLHGGEVRVENGPERGCDFFVTLPS